MLLYAIVKSERASKGQGGNERLDTLYTIGETREPFMSVSMTVRGERGQESVLVHIRDYRADTVEEREIPLGEYRVKGKKQEA